jgi:cell division protein FtsW
MGMIANAARHEPEAVAALRAGRDDKVNRLLRLALPEPYVPSRTEALRERLRSRPAPAKPPKASKPPKSPKGPKPKKAQRKQPRESARNAAAGAGSERGSGHHRVGQRQSGQRRAAATSRSGGARTRALERRR